MSERGVAEDSAVLTGLEEVCAQEFGAPVLTSAVDAQSVLPESRVVTWLMGAQIRDAPEAGYTNIISSLGPKVGDLDATAPDGKTRLRIHAELTGPETATVHVHISDGGTVRCLFTKYSVAPKSPGCTVHEENVLRTNARGVRPWSNRVPRNPFSFLSERSWRARQLALLKKELEQANRTP